MKKYKFLRLKGKKIVSNSGNQGWKIGEWVKCKEKLDMCNVGLHCSPTIYQAFSYVQGEVVAKVECRGKKIIQEDKECWEEMRIVEARKWDKKASVSLAIYSAQLVLKNYEKEYPGDMRPREAIEAAKKVLFHDTPKNRAAAWSAWSAARSAAESAAWSAAWSARSAAIKKIQKYMEKIYENLERIS
jgi:hypothetical protein